MYLLVIKSSSSGICSFILVEAHDDNSKMVTANNKKIEKVDVLNFITLFSASDIKITQCLKLRESIYQQLYKGLFIMYKLRYFREMINLSHPFHRPAKAKQVPELSTYLRIFTFTFLNM